MSIKLSQENPFFMIKTFFIVAISFFSTATFTSGEAISEVRCMKDLMGRTVCKDDRGGSSTVTPNSPGMLPGATIQDNNGNTTRCVQTQLGTLICR